VQKVCAAKSVRPLNHFLSRESKGKGAQAKCFHTLGALGFFSLSRESKGKWVSCELTILGRKTIFLAI
jgi:hypothetical protein